jgi:hypothetical protein
MVKLLFIPLSGVLKEIKFFSAWETPSTSNQSKQERN